MAGVRFMLLAVAVLLGGCLDSSDEKQAPADPIVVSAPDDYTYLGSNAPDRPHLHDYWNGASMVVVMTATVREVGPGMGGGADLLVHRFEPPSGQVVPQGTAFVDVTIAWEDAVGDMYSMPRLWVQTAADHEPVPVADLVSGEPVRVPSTNEANDLPHQLLSAWGFEFRVSDPPLPEPFLRFKGEIEIVVTATRGLDIPLYPAHPDRWHGADEVELVDATHTLAYAHDPGDGGCDGVSCQMIHTPADGIIVPPGAARIDVSLATDVGVTTIGLAVHGPDSRAFRDIVPMREDEGMRFYEIPVEAFWDGPYAQQSQWAFVATIEGPVKDGATYEEYRLTAVVVRGDAPK